MLPPLSGLLCLWLCGATAASRLQRPPTDQTLGPRSESSPVDWNARSRGWRAVLGADKVGTLGVGAQQPPRAVRKSDAQDGALRTEDEELRGDGCCPGEAPEHYPLLGRSGQQWREGRSPKARRTERSEPLQDGAAPEAAPAAMAQAQEQEEGAPLGLNATDYEEEEEEEEYSGPDLPDPTPLLPVNTRRKQVKNPFYPLGAEAYGAYAVMIVAAVIFSVGVIGNVSVMCIVCHNYYMRSISNSLLANLALWDFVVIFFCLPLVVFHQLTKNWLLGDFSCRIIPYLEVRGRAQRSPVADGVFKDHPSGFHQQSEPKRFSRWRTGCNQKRLHR